jgi:hypothetical protein
MLIIWAKYLLLSQVLPIFFVYDTQALMAGLLKLTLKLKLILNKEDMGVWTVAVLARYVHTGPAQRKASTYRLYIRPPYKTS